MLQTIQLFQHYPAVQQSKTIIVCTTHCDPATMLVPLQATLYISNFCFPVSSICSFICYFHSVWDVCCHQTTHCMCQEKYKNVRAAYYSATQSDQTTCPLHRHVKDSTHAHFPEPQKQTHIYTLCCCSMLYESYPTWNWLGSITRWVKDWVGGGEGHTSGWGAGEKEKKSVNAAAKKTSKLSRDSTTHTVTHIHSIVPLAYEHVCKVIKFLKLSTSFILHSILCT